VKIVISGYYGFGNAGDEAILEAMVRDLRALAPGARLVVLSADPAATAARCGVEAVPRMHLPSVLGALRGADLFISGGGSLLQDATSWRSVPYYAGIDCAWRGGWASRCLSTPKASDRCAALGCGGWLPGP